MKRQLAIFYIFILGAFVSEAQNNFEFLNKETLLRREKQYMIANDTVKSLALPLLQKEIPADSVSPAKFLKAVSERPLFSSKSKLIQINPIISSLYYKALNADDCYLLNGGLSFRANWTTKLATSLNVSAYSVKYPENIAVGINSMQIIPHFGRDYSTSGQAYNFLSLTGSVSYSPSKYFNFQAGRDKNFWGHGYRSLWLSDNSNAFPYVKTTVNVWKIKYLIMYSILKDIDSDYNTINLTEKYASIHCFSLKIHPRWDIELFETVVWRGRDSLGYRGFDVNYLNPIVFYRPVDFSLGSPDNVIMGAGSNLRLGKSDYLYGQLIIDEFKLAELKAGNGWWANKYAIQIGFKTYHFLKVKNWYWLAEVNIIRPFTYSHSNSLENYGNYIQPLAHPLGANCKEVLTVSDYSFKRNSIRFKAIYSVYGTDSSIVNYGGNIYRSYDDSRNEYGNYIGQGQANERLQLELKYSYMVNPEWNTAFNFGFRMYMINSASSFKNTYVFGGISTNLYNDDWFD